MDLACYVVVREDDAWTICASGVRLITCRDRHTAFETARHAAALLYRGYPCREPVVADSRRGAAGLAANHASG
ncbi:MAG TPA: hypothetical protein VFU97_15170 [Xanthobacteraceae bacterium]|jgi:hypothetical protein|nr:hypothetical protein [Xanthobacteraceae bacterium]